MSYVGARLAPWFNVAPNDRFCRRAAHAGGARFLGHVKRHTPIDTGFLLDSLYQTPVVRIVDSLGRTAYESGPATDAEYGPPIEHGWGLWGPKHAKYEIRPKDPNGWLHWIDPHTGLDVFAKKVMHPGAPGAHMFVMGAALTRDELPLIVRPHLERWKVEVERQNRSDWGLGRGRL